MKLKTHKATAKRFKKTKTGKFLHRKAGQDHFNAREGGKVTRAKRRDIVMHSAHEKTLRMLMPNG